jgi:hypothetical protein
MRIYSVVLLCLMSVVQGNHPSIEFEFFSKDFGNVIQGQIVKQAFQFTNKGKGLLEIIDMEKS